MRNYGRLTFSGPNTPSSSAGRMLDRHIRDNIWPEGNPDVLSRQKESDRYHGMTGLHSGTRGWTSFVEPDLGEATKKAESIREIEFDKLKISHAKKLKAKERQRAKGPDRMVGRFAFYEMGKKKERGVE